MKRLSGSHNIPEAARKKSFRSGKIKRKIDRNKIDFQGYNIQTYSCYARDQTAEAEG
jgi:hypothetical protein